MLEIKEMSKSFIINTSTSIMTKALNIMLNNNLIEKNTYKDIKLVGDSYDYSETTCVCFFTWLFNDEYLITRLNCLNNEFEVIYDDKILKYDFLTQELKKSEVLKNLKTEKEK